MFRKLFPLVLILIAGSVSGWLLLRSFSIHPPDRAFYYWKTEWTGTPEEKAALQNSQIRRLYMRFFDVVWDPSDRKTHPVSPLRFSAPPPNDVEIVPVVYLVNAVFLKMDASDVPQLADNVWGKVASMTAEQRIAFSEFQVDCDWSDDSRANYFRFVDLLHHKAKSEGKILSSTLRLHQVKYAQRTGIPPADRGMLMFYNFSQIQGREPGHSIFDAGDAGKYASFISSYPLNLDVALPIFSWSVHAREGSVLGLLEGIGSADAGSFDGFQQQAPDRFVATRSFFFRGRYFLEGDSLLIEETTPATTRQAAVLARKGAGWRKRYDTVALFDLDAKRFDLYSNAEIRSILGQF